MYRLKSYLLKYKLLLIVGFLFVIFKNMFQAFAPFVISEVLDMLTGKLSLAELKLYDGFISEIVAYSGLSVLTIYILLFVIVEFFNGGFLFYMRMTLIKASRLIEYDLRRDFFGHLQRLHLQFFQDSRTGDLISRATNDLGNVRSVLGPGIMYTANTIVAFVYVIPMMLYISPRLTLLAFVPLLVLSLIVSQLAKRLHKRAHQVQERLSNISSKAQENFSGIRIIKSYVQENNEINAFKQLSREYIQDNLNMVKVRGALMSSVVLTMGFSVTVLLYVGGSLVMNDTITFGEFTAFNFYLVMLIWPMISLGWVVDIFQRGTASMKRMNKIFETEPLIRDNGAPVSSERLQGVVEFRNLTFRYGPELDPVLKNISMTIEQGMTVAIVGRTGSGKSTLINLLPRLYEVPRGTIFIDGREIHDIPLHVLRSSIATVPQTTFLFSDSIRENIAFGLEDGLVKDEQIDWSSEVSQLKENVLEFPNQFNTMVGEKGITLSGGQKQRTAISRAVIKDPTILILDDALSSVDTHTEDEILKRLQGIMKDRTSLIVSHRVSTIKDADLIVVIDEGEIAEMGTHEQLLEEGGLYSEMYQRQLLEQEIEVIDSDNGNSGGTLS